jgi:hypothetical protein
MDWQFKLRTTDVISVSPEVNPMRKRELKALSVLNLKFVNIGATSRLISMPETTQSTRVFFSLDGA